MNDINYNKPLFQATLLDLRTVIQDVMVEQPFQPEKELVAKHRYVYGIAGIAQLFQCSMGTAQRIKSSGAIDAAVSQTGKILVTDADYAIELLRVNKQWRKSVAVRGRKPV